MTRTLIFLILLALLTAAVNAQTQIDVSRVKYAAQLGMDGKVLASQLPPNTGGGSGASTLNDLVGCTPTVSGKVITLPTTCKVATATNSQAVPAPSNFTFDATNATPGKIYIGFDSGAFSVWTNTGNYACGAGASCVPGTTMYPNGVLRIASFTVSPGGSLSAASLDMTQNQQKIIFSGPNANDTTDPTTGIRTVSFAEQHTPRLVAGNSDALNDNDCGNEVIYKASGAIAVTVAQAGAGGLFKNGCRITISVQGSGATLTLTPSVSKVRDQASFQMTTSPFRYVVTSDGQNYY